VTGRVSGLWVYPVKSMRGQSLDVADIETRGIVGDRLYAVRDEAGKFGSGKNTRRFARMEGLARWSARRHDERLEVRPPDGEWLDASNAATADLLTAQVGRPVQITREADVSHFDAAPLHLLTSADLAALAQYSGARAACETFRPNILIESETRSADWIGQRLTLGDIELEIIAPTERCLMVNVTPTGDRGPDFLRAIAQRMDECFGVYANVVQVGRITLRDMVAARK